MTTLPDEALGKAPGRGRLEGRRALVVGAGTRRSDDPEAPIGNGRAISVLAAREGAMVACVDNNRAAADETVRLIADGGGKAHAIVADVSDPAACPQLVDDAIAAIGDLDHVVMNVGVGVGFGTEGTTAEQWDATFAVNLRAHFLVAKAAMSACAESLRSIVFISSVAGLRPGSRIPAYDASKAGVLGLSRHIALEGSRLGIRANVVVPGLIDTPLGRLASAGRPSRNRTPVLLGRQGTAWEVAYATVFLLSDESSYVTGQTLVVDGGMNG